MPAALGERYEVICLEIFSQVGETVRARPTLFRHDRFDVGRAEHLSRAVSDPSAMINGFSLMLVLPVPLARQLPETLFIVGVILPLICPLRIVVLKIFCTQIG